MARGKELSVGEKGMVVRVLKYFKDQKKLFWKQPRTGKNRFISFCCH